MCPGGQLNQTCHTTSGVTLLAWNITLQHRYEQRFISSMGSADSAAPLTEGQTMFQFLRTSVSPLISTIMIDNVTAALNGTRVECYYSGRVMSTTIINVVRPGMSYNSFKLANVVWNPIRKHVHPWTLIL